MNEHPTKYPPLYTKDEVVKDILENMNIDEKASVKNMSKDKLGDFHFGWGQYLRNYYQMWHNPELVKSTGKEHPDDASAVIIEEVWAILQGMDEPGLEAPPEPPEIGKNIYFQWHLDTECLEISCSRWSIVIDQISLDFAEAVAEAMHTKLLQKQVGYIHPDVAPVTIHERRSAAVSIRKYPKYRGEASNEISVRWQVTEQLLEISCGGTDIRIEIIDSAFAEQIAYAMRLGLPHIESFFDSGSDPQITHRTSNARIRLWDYPNRTSPP